MRSFLPAVGEGPRGKYAQVLAGRSVGELQRAVVSAGWLLVVLWAGGQQLSADLLPGVLAADAQQ